MSKAWKYLIIATLILCIFFRFANLDKEAYSADEVRSILRLSGYTSSEFIDTVFIGDPIEAGEILKYQKPNPEKNLGNAIQALAGNPEHPPLYHLLTRFWMQIFNTPVAARVASILISFLVFPLLYWLCLELFNSPLVGWIAIMLFSLSPYHTILAQNTTQYSLFTLMIAASSTFLLKALRVSRWQNWLFYTATLILGFYTHLFFFVVAFGQGLYVFILERFRLTKNLVSYSLASLTAVLAFSPWLILILTNLDKIERNTTYYEQFQTSLSRILRTFQANIANTFIDFYNTTRIEPIFNWLILILVIYALYFLCRTTPLRVWLFVILLVIITPIVQIIPDAFGQSIRSLQARYYLPCFLGIQLTISYLLAMKISSIHSKDWQKKLWILILLSLLFLGAISGTYIARIHSWEPGTASTKNLDLAPIINQSQKPLVISDATHSFVLALCHLIREDVKFQLFKKGEIEKVEKKLDLPQATTEYSDVFLYSTSDELEAYLEKQKGFKIQMDEKKLPKIVRQ